MALPYRSRLLLCCIALFPAFASAAQTAATADEPDRGRELFVVHCARCHGVNGQGGEGADLTRPKLRFAPDDKALADVIRNGIRGTGMPGNIIPTDAEVQAIAQYVRSLGQIETSEPPGDATRGEMLFATQGACFACHIVAGKGNGIGPELTDIGARRGLTYLQQALVEPGAAHPRSVAPLSDRFVGFLTIRLATADGRAVEGFRINEDAFSIQIRDLTGRIHSFEKLELTKLEKVFGHSLMPGYAQTLSADERNDVISYLMSLQGKP